MYISIYLSAPTFVSLALSLDVTLPPAPPSPLSCVAAEEYEVRAVPASLGKYKLTVYCITVSKLHIRR